MYFKSSGTTKTHAGFKKVTTYVSTADDNDKAHSNPNKTKYLRAKARYERDKGDTSLYGEHVTGEDLRQMYLYKPYTKRAIATATNMQGHTKADFIRDEQELMKNWHGVKSHEFVISPAPSDKIGPHDPASVERFTDYAVLLAKATFNGKFVKTSPYKYHYHDKKTGKTHVWTRYHYQYSYDPKRDTADRFSYFFSVQPDSFHNSHTHGHLVVLDRDMKTGRGMVGGYYSLRHCYKSVRRATRIWNRRHPEHQMSSSVKPGRRADRYQQRIIEALEAIKRDKKITSRKKLIKALRDRGIRAKFVKQTKHRRHAGWKFRYRKTGWVKASNLSKIKVGRPFSTQGIAKMLSVHRKQMARIRHHARAKVEEARLQRIYPAGSPSLPEVHGFPGTDYIQHLADTGELFKLQAGQEKKIEAAHHRWLLKSPRRLARHYAKADPGHEVAVMMPHLSSNPVRKSVPKVSECYQSKCYPTYHFKDAKTGRQEFHILDGELKYTDNDKDWFSRVFGTLVSDFHSFGDKLGSRLVHSSIRKHWNRLTSSIKGYIKGHYQLPFRDKLYNLSCKAPRNYNGIMTLYFTRNSKSSYQLGLKHIKSFGDYKHDFFKLLGNEKARKELYAFSKRYNLTSWLDNHKLKDSYDYSKKMKARKRKQKHNKILHIYGENDYYYHLGKYVYYSGKTNKPLEMKKMYTVSKKRMTKIEKKYPHAVENFGLDKYIKGYHAKAYPSFKNLQHSAEKKSEAVSNRQNIHEEFEQILHKANKTYHPTNGPQQQGPTMS